MYITYMGNKLNNKKGENMSKSPHDVFKAPVSQEDLVIAWHTVGFDKYIKTLSEMYDIPVDQFYDACKEEQEVRDEIVGNFAKGMEVA
jgi:hypothetical protein